MPVVIPTDEQDALPEGIERSKILTVISCLFISSLFLMMDNGFMPASSVLFKEEMKMNNAEFGFVGSFVYLGQALGSFIASPILQRASPKFVLAFCLVLNIISLVVFTLTDIYAILLFMRAITGFVQVFFTIFMPVWADSFGSENQKTLWLALLIVSNPLGGVLGYAMMAGLQFSLGWRWAFYIQSIILFPNILILLYVPS